MSSHLRHHEVAVQQPYYQPPSSTANLDDAHKQDATTTANFGFFSGASKVYASSSTFTDVAGHQFNQNIHLHALNETAWLDKLPRSTEAGYSSKPHRTCSRNTRKEVLDAIERWEADETDKFVYWLWGTAGCGKSTISQTIAERSAKKGRLGASFFCSRDFPDRRNPKLIFPTLAHHLADRFPEFKTVLANIVYSDPNVGNDAPTFQLEKLLVQPLKRTTISCTIIVDALDECEDNEPDSAFLSALAEHVNEIPTVKFFITGRPEDRIRYGFEQLQPKEFPLHKVESATVHSDIKSYVKTELEGIAQRRRRCISGPWPSDKDVALILNRCDGIFIIASVIIKFVSDRHALPQDQLKRILDMPHSTIYEGMSGIDQMYHQILKASFFDVNTDVDRFFDQLHLVVGSIVLALTPLSHTSLAKILKMTSQEIRGKLSCLHSVLIVPESDSEEIKIYHKSFADFITDPKRCRDPRYHIDPHAQHLKLGIRCLELMNTTLTKNICNLPRYSLNKDIKDLPERRRQHIGAPLTYACSSWAKHLWSSGVKTCDDIHGIISLINDWLQKRFLSWLEVLSIESNLQVSVYALHDVRLWLTDAGSLASSLLNLINDCERYILQFFDIMEQSAMHVYHSALPWTPASSVIRGLYEKELETEARLLNAVDTTWPAYVRTISTDNRINGIVFSPSGALIAVSGERTLQIYDTMTGVRRATIDECGWPCTFSPDDSLIVSENHCREVRVFDPQTGDLVRTFEGHTDDINSVAFSPCGTMVASGSDDGTARVWSMSSGCCQWISEGHPGEVRAVCWSARGDQVISGSEDGTVRVWEVSTGMCLKILGEHTGRMIAVENVGRSDLSFLAASESVSSLRDTVEGTVTAVASSHASFLVAASKFASGHWSWDVKVYDSQSYDVIHTISSDHPINSVRFSADGDRIMYTGETGIILDLAKKINVSSIPYDEGDIAAFSPDGSCVASASRKGNYAKIWRPSRHEHDGVSVHRECDPVQGLFFSPDGQVVVSTYKSCVKVWDATTGTCLLTSDAITSSYFYKKTVVFSSNSTFAACRVGKFTVWMFNIHTRPVVKSLDITNHNTDAIAVSSDCSRFLSLWNKYLILWDLENGKCLACMEYTPLHQHFYSLQVGFTLDGNSVFVDDHVNTHCWRIYPASPSRNQFASLPMAFIPVSQELSRQDRSRPSLYQDEWIMDHDGRCLLWLLPDKRSNIYSTGSHEKKIALGTDSEVYVFDFSDVLPPS